MDDPDSDGSITIGGGDKNAAPDALRACQQYSGKAGSGTQPTADQLRRLRRLAACVRTHGVPDFPDPDPRTGSFRTEGIDRSALTAALRHCSGGAS